MLLVVKNLMLGVYLKQFTFLETFEEVKWACRAPLSSGKLCPRKDRVKCPLHGKVIARDNMGNPVNKAEVGKLPEVMTPPAGIYFRFGLQSTWENSLLLHFVTQ